MCLPNLSFVAAPQGAADSASPLPYRRHSRDKDRLSANEQYLTGTVAKDDLECDSQSHVDSLIHVENIFTIPCLRLKVFIILGDEAAITGHLSQKHSSVAIHHLQRPKNNVATLRQVNVNTQYAD